MLSRVADACYWIGRYLERAENVARFADVNQYLLADFPDGDTQQWRPLVEITADEAMFEANYGEPARENVLRFLTFDAHYPNSISACVQQARENARGIRDTITLEMWEQINRCHDMVESSSIAHANGDIPYYFYARVKDAVHLFHGIMEDTMSHGEAWQFCRLGQYMERADKTSRLLDVKYFMLLPSAEDVGTPFDELHWAAVLRSASALEMYRKKWGLIRPDRIIEFLLMDRVFPRSVFHCLQQAQRCLHMISNTPVGSYTHDAEQRLGALVARLSYLHPADIVSGGLHEFIDALQEQMNDVDRAIFDQYFAIRSAVAVPDSGFNAQPQQ